MQVETQSRNGRVEQVEPLTAWASPQPIGIFSLPTGYLVLPAPQQNASAALKALLNGHIETEMPPEWQFFKASAHGHTQTALNLLTGNDPISRYNRFVLQSDPAEYAQLAASLPAPLAQLLAVVGYTLGYADQLPAPDGLKNEWAAMVWLTHATHALEIDEPSRAVEALDKAIATARPVSPILCAQALSQLAQVRRNMPGHIAGLIMQYYREAIRQAGDTPLPHFRAGLWLDLGMVYHEGANNQRGALIEAVKCYQQALQLGLSLEQAPEMYALAQNNLALAYLAMPMVEASDQLRMGVAVQSLREALKVYQKETHTELWASTQLNLANALQYLPSSHPQENLIQAVEIYEELLEVRNKAFDPVGYARLLSNQANALAHLGIFQPAIEKLNEAYKLFHWHNEIGLAEQVLEMVSQINEKKTT